MGQFSSSPLVYLVIIALIAFIPYIAFTLFLNGFHKILYGKGSFLIFIPFFFFQSYFLGKVCFNSAFGWGMVALGFVSSQTTLLGKNMTIIRDNQLRNTITTIYIIIQIVLIIYAIIKFVRIKKQMKMGAVAANGNTEGQVPLGPIDQTDPFAVQTPTQAMPANQINVQTIQPEAAAEESQTATIQPTTTSSIAGVDPNATIESIIHHAPATNSQEPAVSNATVESEVEQLDLNPTTEINTIPVDTNNPNNM